MDLQTFLQYLDESNTKLVIINEYKNYYGDMVEEQTSLNIVLKDYIKWFKSKNWSGLR